jgi:mRNA interferase RelE/StbE
MERYKILLHKSVSKDLRPIPNKDLQKILAVIESLSDESRPAGIEKLSGQNKYWLRRGNYRILYEVKDDESVVVVVGVGHR